MHGYIRDTYDNQPIPYAEVNLTCGEGMGVVVQADGTGAYSFTMGELYDAIDYSCPFAMGIGMYATAATYPQGNEEWSGNRYDVDWYDWIVGNFSGENFDFHLDGNGNQNGGSNGNVKIEGNVANLTTATGSKTVTLTVDESCALSDVSAIAPTSLTATDAGYSYTTGFVRFTATGCDQNKTTVQLLYHGTSPDNLTVRKYNPTNNAFFTITGATVAKTGNDTIVTYNVVDDGDLDINKTPGVITDPVGLGSLRIGVPNTGIGGGGAN